MLVWVSFAGGQRLRRIAVGSIQAGARYSAMHDAGMGALGISRGADQDGSNPAETFHDVQRYIKSDYVDKISDDSRLSFGAVRTMLMSLDDRSTSEERQSIQPSNG